MKNDFFNEREVRPDVVKIAIIITDGKSSNKSETARQAALLRDQGIYVFSIGVGRALDERELHLIAGQPSKDYVFKVDNYKALDKIKKILSTKACQGKIVFVLNYLYKFLLNSCVCSFRNFVPYPQIYSTLQH